MRIAPATFVVTKAQRPPRAVELMLRYGASYGCMLVALAAGQLVSTNAFIILLTGITLLGLPVSLWLRQMLGRSPRYKRRRVILNTVIVSGTFISGVTYMALAHPELISANFMRVLMIDYGVADSVKVLMELFLIFSTCRSLGIVTDHEAVLSAVPSFSALLLLMVIHRGPQVVFYFVLWTVMAAVLFALDHRAEAAGQVDGRIVAVRAGQEVRLSARSLATVLTLSLIIAMGIAYTLSSRSPQDRSQLERLVMSIASGASKLTLNLPDISVNNGPERQIDFTSGPALPTQTELWRVGAITFDHQLIYPQYWRMFTLAYYNGKSWSQAPGSGVTVSQERLNKDQWPFLPRNENGFRGRPRRRYPSLAGYDVNIPVYNNHRLLHDFGSAQRYVRIMMESRAANVGFVPQLPVVKAVREQSESFMSGFGNSSDGGKPIRVRADGGLDMGVLQIGQQVRMLASVPADAQYGVSGSPPQLVNENPNPAATISDSDREMYLQLPVHLREKSSLLRKFVQDVLKDADADENDYSKAKRLAMAIESRGIYTLRPPAVPEGADAAEYFILDNPRGYCTYFAGGLAVLCRLAGIPARVVSGFVNPEWDSQTGMGTLREANAHAWTEIWVPGWGWAPLDATPPSDRGNNSLSAWENWQDFVSASVVASRDWLRSKPWFLFVPFLLLAIAGALFVKRYGLPLILQRWLISWRRKGYYGNADQANQAVLRSYYSMANRLTRRFRPRTKWETAQEWVEAAIHGLQLENPETFRELTALYERARYAPPLIKNETAARAITLLGILSWKKLQIDK